jgi:acetyltransferase-like isoleucine patch superfamily enzyme
MYGHVLGPLKEGRLEIGRGVTFLAGCWLSLPGEGRINIGRNVWVNGNVMLHAYDLIEIGDFTMISRGTLIMDAIHRIDVPDRPFLPQPMIMKGPIRIGSNVWIGHNAAIMGGVTIGDRAIVGANSVVTRDVEPGATVGGVPARVIESTTRPRAPRDSGDQAGAL